VKRDKLVRESKRLNHPLIEVKFTEVESRVVAAVVGEGETGM
jgi:hypothetical protein